MSRPEQTKLIADQVLRYLKQDPTQLLDILAADPELTMGRLNEIGQRVRTIERQRAAEAERNALLANVRRRTWPRIDPGRPKFGNPAGSVQIVVYDDFECPFSKRGWQSVRELMEVFPGDVGLFVKHFPLSNFHEFAEPAARYFEALRILQPGAEWRFRAAVLEDENNLQSIEQLDAFVVAVGGVINDVRQKSGARIIDRILAEDQSEARSFGVTGSPSFMVNGVAIVGAYPVEHFLDVIALTKELE